jgi:hypothetical protein
VVLVREPPQVLAQTLVSQPPLELQQHPLQPLHVLRNKPVRQVLLVLRQPWLLTYLTQLMSLFRFMKYQAEQQ